MRDFLYISPVPADEDCAQVGQDNYSQRAIVECKAFIDQIRRAYGEEPGSARLRVKSNPHDFGTYYEVIVEFDDQSVVEQDYAYDIEGDELSKLYEWDDQAIQHLAGQGVEVDR